MEQQFIYMRLKVIKSWFRVIRTRFLLASVIAVTNGLTIAVWRYRQFDLLYAILTFVGVICLHASVDLLNDYWDYKRGIDTIFTKRTKFSGGTGVLPGKLLKPNSVYSAGVIFLLLGSLVGAYFVIIRGITVAIILGFAIVAIYFYSTTIVNVGLGEVFVAAKSTMIVLGSFYVQTGVIEPSAVYIGIIVGILSASVLFINSFPDYEADRSKGRRSLVILLGKQKASRVFGILIIFPYILVIAAIFLGYAKIYSIVCFVSIPFAFKIIKYTQKYSESIDKFVPIMAATVMYARITGFTLAISLLL
jgi:1,4-dihydroxy-2-naphthoate octaprenyltransferase